MPRISVIVPFYNAANHIDRCITSVLAQSFSDFELICVNDGSKDHSAQVVRRFARNDSRIVLLEHATNLGPGAARNTGVARARASYVTFIDSDDFVDRNLFETLFRVTDRGFFDIVESGCRAINEVGEVLWQYQPTASRIMDLRAVSDSILLMQEWSVHQKLWKKALFDENDIRFPGNNFWDDIAVVPVLTVCAANLAKIDYIGYNYLQRTESITHTRSLKHIADFFRSHEYFRSFLTKRGVFDKYGNSFKKSVDKIADWFMRHMQLRNLSDPEMSEKLIRIYNIIAGEYLLDSTVIERIPAAKLETAFEASLTLDFGQSDATLRSAVRRSLKAYHAH